MFSFCVDPASLGDLAWMACYLTTGKHMAIYTSVFTVLLLLAITKNRKNAMSGTPRTIAI